MEGFGLPNFESIRCQRLVVASDIPVFREIWGDSLVYFDPYDTRDIANKIINTLKLNTNKYSLKVEKAKKILGDYNWEKSAEITLDVYNRIFQK